MHVVKINEKEYTYPDSAEEMTLGLWEEIQTYVKNRITDKYSYDDVLEIIYLITDIDKELFLKSSVDLFNVIYNTISWVFEINFDKIKPSKTLFIEGKEYSYGESENISLREWVDIDTILSKFPDEKKFSGILAVRMREGNKEYSDKESEQIEERIQFWKKQKVNEVMPLVNFFLLKEEMLLTNFQSYSMAVALSQMQMELIKNSLKSGDGTIRFAKWRKMILKRLIPSLEKEYSKCLHTYHTLRTKITQLTTIN